MHKVVDEIVTSNEWRDGEFAKLKVGSIGLDEALWCRMCIPMIYAHWEGYVVTSLKILIDYRTTAANGPGRRHCVRPGRHRSGAGPAAQSP